jgi:hypothetical protein
MGMQSPFVGSSTSAITPSLGVGGLSAPSLGSTGSLTGSPLGMDAMFPSTMDTFGSEASIPQMLMQVLQMLQMLLSQLFGGMGQSPMSGMDSGSSGSGSSDSPVGGSSSCGGSGGGGSPYDGGSSGGDSGVGGSSGSDSGGVDPYSGASGGPDSTSGSGGGDYGGSGGDYGGDSTAGSGGSDSGPTGGGNNAPVSNKGGVQFGVNGRPTWQGSSYQKLSPDEQMKKVKGMGLSTYAIDLNSQNNSQDQELLSAAQRNGVQIQGNIGIDRNSVHSFDDAYAKAKAEGAAIGKQAGGKVKYFQLDNELDHFVDPEGDGTMDPQKYQIALGIVKGLSDGLKSTDPGAKTIVNSTQAPSGLPFLKQLQKDGVDWDVTGYHWYSQTDGNDIETSGSTQNGGGTTVANVAKELGKPIWLTEFNGGANGSGPTANRQKNAGIISNQIKDILQHASEYGIIGANVHELMDEPELGSSESQYGMLDGNGNDTPSSLAIKQMLASNG